MTESLMKIGKILDLQKGQTERVLKQVLRQQKNLLDQADTHDGAVKRAQKDLHLQAPSTLMTGEKWIQLQQGKAKQLRAEAAAMQSDIHKLTLQLQAHIKKQSGFDALKKSYQKKLAMQEEEKADQEMLNIVQLGRGKR